MKRIDAEKTFADSPEMKMRDSLLDQQIAAVLASRPVVSIPDGFAARVAGASAAQSMPSLPHLRLRWGLSAALIGAALLLGAMFWLASATQAEDRLGAFAVLLQTLCLGEFALAVYGAARFSRLLE